VYPNLKTTKLVMTIAPLTHRTDLHLLTPKYALNRRIGGLLGKCNFDCLYVVNFNELINDHFWRSEANMILTQDLDLVPIGYFKVACAQEMTFNGLGSPYHLDCGH
jgi:hypothetical protein